MHSIARSTSVTLRHSAFRSWRAATSPLTSPSPSPSSTRSSRRSIGRAEARSADGCSGTTITDRWYTIVGVVPAVKQASLAETTIKETIYWHYEQRPEPAAVLAVRTVVPPSQIAGAVSAAVAMLDPEVAVSDTRLLDERVEGSLGPQRMPMVLTLVFAGVAFVLAVIGIYGVLAWAVSQRVNEIGVRMALGARAADIGRMILRQGGKLIAIGLVVGVAGALALGRVLSSQLDRVGSFDCDGARADGRRPRRRGAARELAAGAPRLARRSADGLARRVSKANESMNGGELVSRPSLCAATIGSRRRASRPSPC